MSDLPYRVTVPLLNPNEPEARLAALHVHEGQQVDAGQLLGTFETTKSTSDLVAETSGYVAGLQAAVGETLPAGAVLCYLAADPDWKPLDEPLGAPTDDPVTPEGLRITRPARSLAEAEGLALEALPRGQLVTEQIVRRFLQERQASERVTESDLPRFGPGHLVVYGGGGHGKAVIELVQAAGSHEIAGVLDDGLAAGATVLGVPVLGGGWMLDLLHAAGLRQAANAVGGIGNIRVRVEVFERLAAAGYVCPTVVHPRAFVEPSAKLADGGQVFPHAYVGSDVRVGFGVIVNTGAIISHDCRMGEYANISPGAILAGGVSVGARSLIGMGATLNLGVEIGPGVRIGNGATVKADVPAQGVVRAGSIWPE